MKVKNVLLLALVALCLAAPASASGAGYWWFDHQQNRFPNENEPKEVSPHGLLTITIGANKFGPCTFAFTGSVWSKAGGMGEGTISAPPAANCATNLMGCTVQTSTALNTPWFFTLLATKNVSFTGVKFEMHLSPGCASYGLATTTTVSGNVEGQFVEAADTGGSGWDPATIKFTAAGGLTDGGTATPLDGTIEFGTRFTAIWT